MSQTARIPRIRFTQDDGSPFPDWNVKKLGNAFKWIRTNSLSRAQLTAETGVIQNIHYGDIHTKFLSHFDQLKEDVPYIIGSENSKDISEETYCKVGDMVIADASEDYTDIGKALEIMNVKPRSLVAGLHTYIARPICEFAAGFAGYLFQSFGVRRQIMRVAQGISVLGISKTYLEQIDLPYPHTKEQRKIAGFLGAVDGKLEKLRRKRELLAEYKRGVMQQIFSREIRFRWDDGRPFPDWERKRLREITQVNPKGENLPEVFTYIDLESVTDGILHEPQTIRRDDAPSRAQRTLKKHDILYQTVRPYQKNNLYFNDEGVFVASTGYAQIRTSKQPRFIFQLLHTEGFVRKVLARCTGTSYPAINSNDLAEIVVEVPKAEQEQEKIANFLTAIDDKITVVDQQIEQIEFFKKGLLQQMFV